MYLSRKRHAMSPWRVPVAALLLLLVVPGLALAQKVVVDASVTGTPGPNRVLNGSVAIDIRDGSTLRSVTWRQLSGATARLTSRPNNGVRIKLAASWKYRNELVNVLSEPPISADQLPANVPLPPGEFPGGLQNRWQVVGLNHFALENGGLVRLRVTVVTSSGTYRDEVEIQSHLPFSPTAGLANVPIDVPVLLFGKQQASYNWTLIRPAGSSAVLEAANSRSPSFVPDVVGTYEVRVTQLAGNEPITLTIYAGKWRGVVTGEDQDGRPIADTACTNCHFNLAEDKFTPWAQTGHAEIFKDNLNTSTHYGPACFSCHLVGFDPAADNDGADEASDYQAFLAAGLLNQPSPNNWSMTLEEFPELAQKANIQCENCHGPQVQTADDSEAHGLRGIAVGDPRVSLSADVCASCHGEPLRHSRFQQWQLSGHANYELAVDEGTSSNCARCHTAQGFLAWLPKLLDEVPENDLQNVTVTWTEDEVHPQTCATCHDPHDNGTTTGVATNATVRISGDTPRLVSGFKATAVGAGAICMTCHNSRRGLKNDSTFATHNRAQAPHAGVQADVLMGENAFLVETGVRGRHSFIEDTCVTCHMESTPPPDDLSYEQGGTNHTFYARAEICNDCHKGLEVTNLQHSFEAIIEDLKLSIEAKFIAIIKAQNALGYTVQIPADAEAGTPEVLITNVDDIASLELTESHGNAALDVALENGAHGHTTLSALWVVKPAPEPKVLFYTVTDEKLPKAVWNYLLIHGDGSKGVHNPTWVLRVLNESRKAVGGGGAGAPKLSLTDLVVLNK